MPPESGENGRTRLAVTGIGMVTPVGLGALPSCAAVRADIVRIRALEYFTVENEAFEEEPLLGCSVAGLTDGHLGLGRWTKLASRAIEDLLANVGLTSADLTGAGLYVALPEPERVGTDERLASMLGRRIAEWTRIAGIDARTHTFPDGHAGCLKAVERAAADLERGAVERAIVGGVDSLVEPETLRHFVERRRIKTDDNKDGFVPGEAAAFLMLERPDAAAARGASTLSLLEAPATALEPTRCGSDEPPAGAGLTECLLATFDQLEDGGTATGLVVCDLNGETYRAKEFGTIVPRVFTRFASPWQLWHPADCLGDTGAASCAVSLCIATVAVRQDQARTPNALVWAGSDNGLRGSLYLRRAAA